jgi:hypothetical protein
MRDYGFAVTAQSRCGEKLAKNGEFSRSVTQSARTFAVMGVSKIPLR